MSFEEWHNLYETCKNMTDDDLSELLMKGLIPQLCWGVWSK